MSQPEAGPVRLTKAQREALLLGSFIVGSWAGDVCAPAGGLNTYVTVRRPTFDKLLSLGLVEKVRSSISSTHYGLTEAGRRALAEMEENDGR